MLKLTMEGGRILVVNKDGTKRPFSRIELKSLYNKLGQSEGKATLRKKREQDDE